MDIKTLQDYLLISCSPKTAKVYQKLIRTLVRRGDAMKHIASLAPSTQRSYRTAWSHYKGFQALVVTEDTLEASEAPEVTEAILKWGGDRTLLFRPAVRSTDSTYSAIEGYAFYGEGEDILSIPISLANILDQHRKGENLI